MHVHAVLIVGMFVLEIVGDAEHRGKLPAGLRIEIGVAAAYVDCRMTQAEIGKTLRVVSADGNIAGDISHEIVDAEIPAQRELWSDVTDARHSVGGTAAYIEPERTERACQSRIDAGPALSVRYQQRYGSLSAEQGGREDIARGGEVKIDVGVQIRV